MTMVLVTHEMAFAKSVARQLIFMSNGVVCEAGSADILSHPQTPELRQFIGSGL
jgi:polar amino acid transport system ATP-binding protein